MTNGKPNKSPRQQPKDKNTSVHRIKDNAHTTSEASPFVVVEISHIKGTGVLTLLPDMGADSCHWNQPSQQHWPDAC